jgi:hypothetical protein
VRFKKQKYFILLLKTLRPATYNAGGVVLNSGANSTIASYNASAVKFDNATSTFVRLEIKNSFSALKNALAYYYAGVVVVN